MIEFQNLLILHVLDKLTIDKRTAGIMANDNAKFSDNAINAGAIMGEGGTISGGNIVASSDDVARKVRGETEGKKDYNIQTLISALI